MVERFPEWLRLRLFHIEGVDHDQLAVSELGRQRRAQGAQQLLAREGVIVGARLGSMHGAAVPPQRRTDGADAGASRALLLPELLAGSRNPPAVLGRVGAGALPGAVMLHRLPQQVFMDGAKNLVRQLQRAYRLAAQIVNVDSSHIGFLLAGGARAPRPRSTIPSLLPS